MKNSISSNKNNEPLDYIGLARYYMSLYLVESFDEMSDFDFRHLSLEFNVNQSKHSLGKLNYYLKRHISSEDILVMYLLLNDRELYLGAIKFNMAHNDDIPSFNIDIPVAFINRRTFNSIQDIYWNKKNEYTNGVYYIDKVSSILLGKSLFIDSEHRFNDDIPVVLGPFLFTSSSSIMVLGDKTTLHYMFKVNDFSSKNLYYGVFCSRKAKTALENYLSDTYTYPMFQKRFSKLTKKEYLLLEMAI